jgi:hypothetical protein
VLKGHLITVRLQRDPVLDILGRSGSFLTKVNQITDPTAINQAARQTIKIFDIMNKTGVCYWEAGNGFSIHPDGPIGCGSAWAPVFLFVTSADR